LQLISEVFTAEDAEETLDPIFGSSSVVSVVKDRDREIISASRHCNAPYGR
jgi:hypothetical protein